MLLFLHFDGWWADSWPNRLPVAEKNNLLTLQNERWTFQTDYGKLRLYLILVSGTRAKAGQTWNKPPRDVVDKIEKLLESGKSTTAIKNHYTLVDYELTDQQVLSFRTHPNKRVMTICWSRMQISEVRKEWEGQKEYEQRKKEQDLKKAAQIPTKLNATPDRCFIFWISSWLSNS